jgi:peptidoglycan-associated lipoprotein
MRLSYSLLVIPSFFLLLFSSGCAKKVVVSHNPAPPQSAVPATSSSPRTPTVARNTPPVPSTTPASQASNYPDKATRDRIDVLTARISDAYFDYDKHTLRPDAMNALDKDSTELRDILKQYPGYKLVVEGYADERGSDEYNLGLGDARASAAKNYLLQIGIPSGQMSVVSYGKDRPVCTEHNEACWQKNRRIHITAKPA